MRGIRPRTIVEGALLVAVPIVAVAAGLTAWPIIGASAVAYVLVVAVELTLSRLSETAEPRAEPAPAAPPEPRAEHVQVLRVPHSEPEPEAAPARHWSIWDLEKVAREQAGSDATADEERLFLLLHLREFADADGQLPVEFDGLVRESFGSLATQSSS
jgi:hypothetical protein